MSDFELRPISEEEFPTAFWVASTAFGEDVDPKDVPVARRGFDRERSLCAFEDGRMVGTSTVCSLELTVPGGRSLPTGGLTWATVLPTHRRRGILRRMLAAQLEQMESQGEAVSALLASEGSIYGRFGYGPATHVMGFGIERTQAVLARPVHSTGRIVLLDHAKASVELPDIFESLRALRSGEVSRPSGWWEEYLYDPAQHREGAGGMFHAKYEDAAGRTDGYVTYRIKDEWPGGTPDSTLKVVEMVAAGPDAYTALWDYVLNMDLVKTVCFSRGRVDEPLRWMLSDPRSFRVDRLEDYLWIRLLDIPRALSAREYAAAGDLVLDVRDLFPAQVARRFKLSVNAPGAGGDCRSSLAEPDLQLELSDLGTVFLGGASFSALAASGRIRELSSGAISRADAMFAASTAPYCSTMF